MAEAQPNKKRGGHAVYKLARLLKLNAAETTKFSGEPDLATVEHVGKGLIRSLSVASRNFRMP